MSDTGNVEVGTGPKADPGIRQFDEGWRIVTGDQAGLRLTPLAVGLR